MSSFPDTPTRLLRKLSEQPISVEDESNWAQFVEMYEPVIRAFAVSEGVSQSDIDDVVQDVFARLVRIMRRDGYDSARGRFRAYLRTVMRRVLIDRFRRQSVDHTALQAPFDEDDLTSGDADLSDVVASVPPDAVESFEAKWRQAQFKALLNHVFTKTALSEQSRDIYRAYVLEDGDVHEVARRFAVTPEVVRQVKSRINRMIAALARRLEAE